MNSSTFTSNPSRCSKPVRNRLPSPSWPVSLLTRRKSSVSRAMASGAMGFVLAAFTLAYGLFEVPTGRWGDKYGSRGVMTRIVLWWSAFTVLTGCVMKFSLDSGVRLTVPGTDWQVPLLIDSFVMLLIIRFLFGAGEAGALPNAARVVTRWFPPHRRGPAQGLINTSMLIG